MLELDELWSFVFRKSDKVWVWLALCRKSRQVVAFVAGDRSRASCERLWREIPERYKKASCYSDLWEAYREVIPPEQHEATGKEEGETCPGLRRHRARGRHGHDPPDDERGARG